MRLDLQFKQKSELLISLICANKENFYRAGTCLKFTNEILQDLVDYNLQCLMFDKVISQRPNSP